MKVKITSFNRYPVESAFLERPELYRDIELKHATHIARGFGNSYGDAALNQNGCVVLTERLNRILDFDAINGTVTVEAGLSLRDLLKFIIPRGWFIAVTPGTAKVSLGGCIASDIHGKNHHHIGSFGQHVLSLTLVTATRQCLICSPQENSQIFWATIGGMGLTGIIVDITLQLIPITTSYLCTRYFPTRDLEQTLYCLNDEQYDDFYHVAWIDLINEPRGRGIVMAAHHACIEELPATLKDQPLVTQSSTIEMPPIYFPNWFLNRVSGQYFNRFYHHRLRNKTTSLITYWDYFYPLDRLFGWERLYGKRGFIQYQCVIPKDLAYRTIQKLITILKNGRYPILLATIKRLGPTNEAFLSFPIEGITLALDIPIVDQNLFTVLDRLDECIIESGGRVYLAKDARLAPQNFRIMYPRYQTWLSIKQSTDPNHLFSSSLARRLKLC